MAEQEIVKQNFSDGELSEKMYGRSGLPVFQNGVRRAKNFTIQTQGPAAYDNGNTHAHHTRLNQIANFITFEFNDEQAYMIEATDKMFRFYRNNGIILEDDVVITDITQANPGVVTTSGAHGYSNGDEVFLNNVVGMIEVNGDSFLVANVTATTFELTDVDGNNIDTSLFTLYSSGGIANRIFELETPYTEANDLFQLKFDQDADVMQIAHPFYLPRELTRTDHTEWTLVLPVRTNDPFTDQQTITDITQANPGVVTAVGHSHVNGDIVVIETVVGMVEVNSQPYIVANIAVNTYELTDLNGVNVDTSGFTIYGSSGYSSNQNLIPVAVALYESRLWFAGTGDNPAILHGSRAPDTTTGATRYTDFTLGSPADDAVAFTINAAGSNKIFWLSSTDRLLLAGTFGNVIKITGSDDETAISGGTGSSVKARKIGVIGVENIPPINEESFIMYVQKNALTIKTLEFQFLENNFAAKDENIVSDEITETGGDWSKANATLRANGLKQIKWETGRPSIAWAVRNDGILLGLTFDRAEKVSAWHRHTTGASGEDSYFTCTTVPRPSDHDQLWVGTEREIDGNTRRYVSFKTDTPIFPKAVDFFTGVNNEVEDTARFNRATLEAQKEYVHLHESLTYNGLDAGLDAAASVTPGATTGTAITFTASAAVFASTDVNREIWKRPINGVGTGRARIDIVTNSTTVECTILKGADFDNTNAMLAGDWYLTTDSLSNIDHLEGRSVGVVADGGVHPNVTVANGVVGLDYQASVVHVGLEYEGFLQLMSNQFGGETGPSDAKLKNVREFGFRFSNTLGATFGTDIYRAERIPFTSMPLPVGQPSLTFTGIKRAPYIDGWELDKIAYIRQDKPLPCIIQQIVLFGDTEES